MTGSTTGAHDGGVSRGRTSTDGGATGDPSTWDGLARAFLAGLAVASAGFFHIAAVGTPGLDPPPETAAVFLVAAAAATTSYVLLAHGLRSIGSIAGMLTGAYVVVALALVVAGIYGPPGPETNPIGPVAWVLLALAAAVSGWFARRERSRNA